MLSYLFIFLAGASNAFMDTFLFRVDRSVFKHIGAEKLNPFLTHATNKKFLGTTIDSWHLVKLIMLGFITLAIVFYKPVLGLWDILILPFCWSAGFELFWSKILYRP
jgi:hypothetical protein